MLIIQARFAACVAGCLLLVSVKWAAGRACAENIQPVAPNSAVRDTGGRISDASSAIARARGVLGIPVRVEVVCSAELVTLESDDTPYLSRLLVGRPIWRVTLMDVKIELASTPEGVSDPYRRILDVFLDPDNGRVFKVASRWPEGVPPIPQRWSAETATKSLGESDAEVWKSFPEDGPVTTLFQALDEVQTQGGGGPRAAPQIVAYYVMMSRIQHPEPIAVWSIHLRGTPPLVISLPPGASERPGPNHFRSVVEDATGKLLFSTTSPHPDAPRDR